MASSAIPPTAPMALQMDVTLVFLIRYRLMGSLPFFSLGVLVVVNEGD